MHQYEEDNEQEKIVAHRLNELQRTGFKLDEIVIVSCHGQQKAAFRELEKVGQYSLRKSTAQYDDNGQQIYTNGQVYFETIYRFKGQQSPAIIVIDINEEVEDNDSARRLLYCAMTRATVRLELLVSKNSYWSDVFGEAL